MIRSVILFAWLVVTFRLGAEEKKEASYPFFDYEVARSHEIKPHRRIVPNESVNSGIDELCIHLIVSPTGDVVDAHLTNYEQFQAIWLGLQGEVWQWKFVPFEKNGKPVAAEVEEYIDLVKPEELPTKHVLPPKLRSDSKVEITLDRGYKVMISTNEIVYDDDGSRHSERADAAAVRELAKKFIAEDFYSMNDSYHAGATDIRTDQISISIDGHKKEIEEQEGQWAGMPAVIADLEEEVDIFARTDRWTESSEGMVAALQAEDFNFKSFAAQVMLKAAAEKGQAATVKELLAAGVPLTPIEAPKRAEPYRGVTYENVGWLNAAQKQPEILAILIEAGASKAEQSDKDVALDGAARSGNLDAVRALIAYGADPNADLTKLTVTERSGFMTMQGPGSGSVLIDAAASGNPDVVRQILRYQPELEQRNRRGQTAISMAASEYRDDDEEGARVECVKLLAGAGGDVNTRDELGNTPLHATFQTDVAEELLKLGADINARNQDGDTPIFTTYDRDSYALFIRHGADLTVRNNKGETIFEAVRRRGVAYEEALQKAVAEYGVD